MKIVWICNVMLPCIAQELGESGMVYGGWLDGAIRAIRKTGYQVDITYLFPYSQVVSGSVNGLQYRSFVGADIDGLIAQFSKVLQEVQPDVIHIHGTEYAHSLAVMQASSDCGLVERTVVSIQGLVSICASHYSAYLPESVTKKQTLWDFFYRDSIAKQKKNFERKGMLEQKVLKQAKHIIGRTDWDKACVQQANRNGTYHFCNETLRDAFYEGQWDVSRCERHSIFISQCNYPIKGFHLALETLSHLIKVYPDAHIYTTGPDLLHLTGKRRLRRTYYQKYLAAQICACGLEEHITFLGTLTAEEMKARYLKAHVFLCCSSIENSPNSVGEAMLLGVPVVSSDVGGVKNMLTHGKEGFVYQADAPYMAAYYIGQIFENDALAATFSDAARKHAEHTHNPELNCKQLLSIYREITTEK